MPPSHDAEVLRDLLGQVDVGDERLLRLARPGAEVAVAGLPHAPAHRVVGVPVGVEARGDVADAGALELELRLLRRVEEDVRPVDEGRRAGAREAAALLARLDADAALTARARDGRGAAGAQDLDPHPVIVGTKPAGRAPRTGSRAGAHRPSNVGVGETPYQRRVGGPGHRLEYSADDVIATTSVPAGGSDCLEFEAFNPPRSLPAFRSCSTERLPTVRPRKARVNRRRRARRSEESGERLCSVLRSALALVRAPRSAGSAEDSALAVPESGDRVLDERIAVDDSCARFAHLSFRELSVVSQLGVGGVGGEGKRGYAARRPIWRFSC